jgi:phage-related protein
MQTYQNQTKNQTAQNNNQEISPNTLEYEGLLAENPFVGVNGRNRPRASTATALPPNQSKNPFLPAQAKMSVNPFINPQAKPVANPFVAENAQPTPNPFLKPKNQDQKEEESELELQTEQSHQRLGNAATGEDEARKAVQFKQNLRHNRNLENPTLENNRAITSSPIQRQTDSRTNRPSPDSVIQRSISIPSLIAEPLNNAASNLPGFHLATVIIGFNPITNQAVERNPHNLLRGFMGLVPGGEALFARLQSSGMVDRAITWITTEVNRLNITTNTLEQAIQQAIDNFSITSPLQSTRDAFSPILARITAFAQRVQTQATQLIRETLLGPVANYLRENFSGYELLTVILGQDPATGNPVERSAANFVRGFLRLIGREDIWQRVQQSGALARIYAWYQAEIQRLGISWDNIRGAFRQAWNSLSITDLGNPLAAFERIRGIVAAPIQQIAEFARSAIQQVLTFVFEGVMGAGGARVLATLRQAGAVFNQIVENPAQFLRNLINAIRQGFRQFAGNVLEHLQTGFVEWLTGTLGGAGIQLPETWDFRGILSVVMQVLGITYDRMRGKLVERLGEDNVRRLEQTFDFLRRLVTEGPMAVWEQMQQYLANLQEMIFGRIQEWIITNVIQAAVLRIVSMFNPVGAAIQSIMAIYNTIRFFLERMQQIAALVESIVQSIARIASGNITEAANFIERAMARSIPVILSFLARLLGLGDISARIRAIIEEIQGTVSQAIDRVIDWIIAQAGRLIGRASPDDANSTARPAPNTPDGNNANPNAPNANDPITQGITALREMDRNYENDPSRENAQLVATTIQSRHPALQNIRVVEDEDSFDYEYRTTQSPQTLEVETGEVVQRMKKKSSQRPILDIPTNIIFGDNITKASPLTKKRQGNARTAKEIDGWSHAVKLNAQFGADKNDVVGTKGPWVLGHKIHSRLGGDGLDKRNLFIIDRVANSAMTEIEAITVQKLEQIIKLNDDKDALFHKVMFYEVEYTFWGSNLPLSGFANQINITYGVADSNTKNEEKLGSKSINSSKPSEDLTNIRINLNTLGRENITTLLADKGIIVSFARYLAKIKKAENFKSITPLIRALRVNLTTYNQENPKNSMTQDTLEEQINILRGVLENDLTVKI